MTKTQRNILTGVILAGVATVVLTSPKCKGLCKSVASQVESIGITDILTGLLA
jgi:hypothetical protein